MTNIQILGNITIESLRLKLIFLKNYFSINEIYKNFKIVKNYSENTQNQKKSRKAEIHLIEKLVENDRLIIVKETYRNARQSDISFKFFPLISHFFFTILINLTIHKKIISRIQNTQKRFFLLLNVKKNERNETMFMINIKRSLKGINKHTKEHM